MPENESDSNEQLDLDNLDSAVGGVRGHKKSRRLPKSSTQDCLLMNWMRLPEEAGSLGSNARNMLPAAEKITRVL